MLGAPMCSGPLVAPVGNRLYRRLAVGMGWAGGASGLYTVRRLPTCDTAGCQSAVRGSGWSRAGPGGRRSDVRRPLAAPVGNRLYRRLAVGRVWWRAGCLDYTRLAGCQPAIRQTASLRYGVRVGAEPGREAGAPMRAVMSAVERKNGSKKMKLKNYFAVASLAAALSSNAQPAKITVDAAHPSHAISPTLWGIFFEDINMSTDGGIYPELVRNRSFEDADTPENWKFATRRRQERGGGHHGGRAWPAAAAEPVQPQVAPRESGRRVHAAERRLLGHEHRFRRRLHAEVCGAR